VVGDRPAEADLARVPVVPLVAIEHELPEQPVAVYERDEGERDDSLRAHRGLERCVETGLGDVGDEHRLRIDRVGRPG
jgi:hypothetical protein